MVNNYLKYGDLSTQFYWKRHRSKSYVLEGFNIIFSLYNNQQNTVFCIKVVKLLVTSELVLSIKICLLYQNFFLKNLALIRFTHSWILVQIKSICEGYHKRIVDLEHKKFDLEKEVEFREFQVELEGMI